MSESPEMSNLVDAKYGRLWIDTQQLPASAVFSEFDEPVFVLRAQDDLALHTLTRYRNAAASIEDESKRPSQEWFDSIDAVIGDFAAFRESNPDKIKVAD